MEGLLSWSAYNVQNSSYIPDGWLGGQTDGEMEGEFLQNQSCELWSIKLAFWWQTC